jgi:hypothetical protein
MDTTSMNLRIERLLRGLSESERMAAIVGALVMAAMLSAVALDRLLDRPTTPPVVITVAAAPSSVGDHAVVTSVP